MQVLVPFTSIEFVSIYTISVVTFYALLVSLLKVISCIFYAFVSIQFNGCRHSNNCVLAFLSIPVGLFEYFSSITLVSL